MLLPCLKNVGLVIHYDSNTSTFFSLSSNFHIVNSYSLIHIVNSYIPPNSTSTRFHRNKDITVAWETRTHQCHVCDLLFNTILHGNPADSKLKKVLFEYIILITTDDISLVFSICYQFFSQPDFKGRETMNNTI